MRIDLEPAYVLHRRPYQNTSLMLDLFTHRYGRISAVYKGAKRGKNPISRFCQPFVPLLVSWQGRSDLKTIVGLEIDRSRTLFTLDGLILVSGLYLNELLLRLCPLGDVNEKLFTYYRTTLESLNVILKWGQPVDESGIVSCATERKNELKGAHQLEALLRRFELRLLAELGFGLDLQNEAVSHLPLRKEIRYQYRSGVGFVESGSDEELLADEVLGIKLATSGATLLAMHQEDFTDKETCRFAKILMRSIIGSHLGGKPLQVRGLLFCEQPSASISTK